MRKDYSFIFDEEDKELQLELMGQLGRSDLYFLCKYILGYTEMEEETDIHYKLCEELEGLREKRWDREAVMIFRNSFKTSIAYGFIIQCMITIRNVMVGFGSDTKERADERALILRGMLENNQLLKTLYPDVFWENPQQESDLWRVNEYNIKRDLEALKGHVKPSLSTFGLEPLPTGSHYDVVVLDDVENELNCDKPELIEKLLRNTKAFLPTLNPQACVLLLGTIYAEDGPNTYYQKVWRTYKRPIWDSLRRPSFPSRWPNPEKIRSELNDEWLWAGQYLLESRPRTDKFFYPYAGVELNSFSLVDGTIIYSGGEIKLEETAQYLLVDSGGGASEEQHAAAPKVIVDRCGFAHIAVDKTNKWFTLNVWSHYYSDEQLVDFLFEQYDQYTLKVIGVEKMHHLDAFIRLYFKMKGRNLPLATLLPKKRKKSDRIRAMKPLLPDWYFNKTIRSSYQARLRAWNTEQDHDDDDHDALSYAIDLCRPPTREELDSLNRSRSVYQDRLRYESLAPVEKREWDKVRDIEAEFTPKNHYQQDLEDFFS